MATTTTMKSSICSVTSSHSSSRRCLRSGVGPVVVPSPSATRARGGFKPQALVIQTFGPTPCRPIRYPRTPRIGLGLAGTPLDVLGHLLTPDRLREMARSPRLHPVDVRTLEDRYELQSDCLGMSEEDVTLEVSPDRVLTIAGSRTRKTGAAAATTTPAAATVMPPRAASEAAEPPEVRLSPAAAAGAESPVPDPPSNRYRFQRSFMLPEDADPEGIKAAMEKGVLTVVVPRKAREAVKPRRIRVSGGAV